MNKMEVNETNIGRYGCKLLAYMKEYNHNLYTELLFSGRLEDWLPAKLAGQESALPYVDTVLWRSRSRQGEKRSVHIRFRIATVNSKFHTNPIFEENHELHQNTASVFDGHRPFIRDLHGYHIRLFEQGTIAYECALSFRDLAQFPVKVAKIANFDIAPCRNCGGCIDNSSDFDKVFSTTQRSYGQFASTSVHIPIATKLRKVDLTGEAVGFLLDRKPGGNGGIDELIKPR